MTPLTALLLTNAQPSQDLDNREGMEGREEGRRKRKERELNKIEAESEMLFHTCINNNSAGSCHSTRTETLAEEQNWYHCSYLQAPAV